MQRTWAEAKNGFAKKRRDRGRAANRGVTGQPAGRNEKSVT